MLTLAVRWNVFHWARSIKGVHGYEVGKNSWPQLFEVFLHTRRFILEDTNGFATLKKGEGGLVVYREFIGVEFYTAVLFDQTHRIFDERKGFETQEVHLEQTCRLSYRVVVLGTDHVGVFSGGNRHKVGKVVGGDDDATSVDTGIAYRTFDFHGFLQHLCLEVGALINTAEFFGVGDGFLVAEFVDEFGL